MREDAKKAEKLFKEAKAKNELTKGFDTQNQGRKAASAWSRNERPEDPEAAKKTRTIFGFHRSRLDQNRAEPPEPNKKIQAFRRHTERTLQEKGQHDVWDGFSFKPLVQRRKGQAAGTLKRQVALAGRHLKRQAARKEPSASAAARGKARAMGKPAPAASRGEAAAEALRRAARGLRRGLRRGLLARHLGEKKHTHTHTHMTTHIAHVVFS